MSRKKYLGFKLAGLFLLLVILIGVIINIIFFNSNNNKDGDDIQFEKSYSDVEIINIDLISLPVKIYERDIKEIIIRDNTNIRSLRDENALKIHQEDQVLTITQKKKHTFLSITTGNLIIEVPRGRRLNYKINNISGDVKHNVASKGLLIVKTISGDINIHQSGDQLSIESTSGSLKMHESFKEVLSKTVSGNIYLNANKDSLYLESKSVSGEIKINLKNIRGYLMDYSTTSGSVRDSYQDTKYTKSGQVKSGDGTFKIDVSTVSGSIKLEDWR